MKGGVRIGIQDIVVCENLAFNLLSVWKLEEKDERNLHLQQLCVKSAFLKSPLKVPVFMKLLEGLQCNEVKVHFLSILNLMINEPDLANLDYHSLACPGTVGSCSLEGPGVVGSCSLEGPGVVCSCSLEGPGVVSSCSLEGSGVVGSCSLEGLGVVGSCSLKGPWMVGSCRHEGPGSIDDDFKLFDEMVKTQLMGRILPLSIEFLVATQRTRNLSGNLVAYIHTTGPLYRLGDREGIVSVCEKGGEAGFLLAREIYTRFESTFFRDSFLAACTL
ncbi:unnamed protein product, partial [Timema podura]|nr:unnamed protein product [Timema podura]